MQFMKMDISAVVHNAYEIIALHGQKGIKLSELWVKLGAISDMAWREKIWEQLASVEVLSFHKCNKPNFENYDKLPKVLYNNERTLAILENSQSNEGNLCSSAACDQRMFDVTGEFRNDRFEILIPLADVESRFGSQNVILIAKNPEINQLSGSWDPLTQMPAKFNQLVNYLSVQGVEGGLSCGVGSPLNTAISVKSTTMFHLKKISRLYSLIRWRKILVKKSRLSRNTTSGTCAVLSRFVSPSFLLPDRMIALAKRLADYISKTSPTLSVELRQCTSALGWSHKQARSVIAAFPDYLTVSIKKADMASDGEKQSCRNVKIVNLQKQLGLGGCSSNTPSIGGAQEDFGNEVEDSLLRADDEDFEANAFELESNTPASFGQLSITRHPLRVVFEKILSTGAEGITLQELRNVPNLGIQLSLLRRYIKMLIAGGHVKWLNDQLGRQHVKRYFANSSYTDKISQQRSIGIAVESSSSPTSVDPVPSVATTAKSMFSASLVASARRQVIESCLMDRKALLLSEIVAKLRTVDSKIQGSADRRTAKRLCQELVDEHRIAIVEKPLKTGGSIAVYKLPDLDSDDEAVKSAVARRDRCVKPVAIPVADESELACGPLRIRLVNVGRVTLQYPKMQRVEALHSFMWYLMYGEGRYTELTGQLASCAEYIKEFPKSDDLPLGWTRLASVLDAMPLHFLAYISPASLAILPPTAVSAAINSKLSFGQLAPDLRASALHTWGSFSLAGELRELILLMNALCLVTFTERRSHSMSYLRTCIYVHRATPIVPLVFSTDNATGSATVIVKSATETKFVVFQDVATFWSDLRNECTLSPPSRSSPKHNVKVEPAPVKETSSQAESKTKKSRLAELSRLSLCVPNYDSVPEVREKPLGNGLGPGGSDSRLRLTLSTIWNASKWVAVPRIDQETQMSGVTLRRRTKLMALAGNQSQRRRKPSVPISKSLSKPSSVSPTSTVELSLNNTAKRKRPINVELKANPKKAKKSQTKTIDEQKSNVATGTRRRRRPIRQQSLVTQAETTDIADESGKVYKTLQSLIDSLQAHETYYMSGETDPNLAPKQILERDLAILSLLTFHACVALSAPHDILHGPTTPSFQDVRRMAVFPTIEVNSRSWVSHAVDLLVQLYPYQKQSSLVFQIALAAVDLVLEDKTIRDAAKNPASPAAMAQLWEKIFSSFKSSLFFHDVIFRVHKLLSSENFRGGLSQNNGPEALRLVSDIWGTGSVDDWFRTNVFTPVPPLRCIKSASRAELENRNRRNLTEQTMCAFLVASRLCQLEPHGGQDKDAIYKQLIASDVGTIQKALGRLMSAKIMKRDFVDSVLYNKQKPISNDEEPPDAHIGDYSLTANVKFQIASPHIIQSSKLLSRIGSFMTKTAANVKEIGNDTLTFDIRANEKNCPIFRSFTTSIGVVSLAGALLGTQQRLALDIDAVPIDQVVIMAQDDTGPLQLDSSGKRSSELAVWPLLLKIERQYLEDCLSISNFMPAPALLKFPVQLPIFKTESNRCQVSPESLANVLKDRLGTNDALGNDLIAAYQVVHDFGIAGCSRAVLEENIGKEGFNEKLLKLTQAELVVQVGYVEERLVTAINAYAVWLLTSPPMFPVPWSNADGSINWSALRILLASVSFTVVENPGITALGVGKKLGPSIPPVSLNRLLNVLVNARVLRAVVFRTRCDSPVSLFDEPPEMTCHDHNSDANENGCFWAYPDALIKLGILTCICVLKQESTWTTDKAAA